MHLALFAVLRPKTFMLQAALQVSKAIFRVAAMSSFRVCRHPSLTLAPGKDSATALIAVAATCHIRLRIASRFRKKDVAM